MAKHSKSQAALEFLTTYAWAFLVIIIMMSALAYFGVLNPSKLLPDRCNFGTEIGCSKDLLVVKSGLTNVVDAAGSEDESGVDTLSMRLKNNFGSPVVISDAQITTDASSAGACFALIDKDPVGAAIDPGQGGASPQEVGADENSNTLTWNSDQIITFVGRCITGEVLIAKEKVKFTIEIEYYAASAGAAYKKKIFGEVFTSVQ